MSCQWVEVIEEMAINTDKSPETLELLEWIWLRPFCHHFDLGWIHLYTFSWKTQEGDGGHGICTCWPWQTAGSLQSLKDLIDMAINMLFVCPTHIQCSPGVGFKYTAISCVHDKAWLHILASVYYSFCLTLIIKSYTLPYNLAIWYQRLHSLRKTRPCTTDLL